MRSPGRFGTRKRSLAYRPDRPTVAELAAGGVVFHPAADRILVLHEEEEDRWCLPKGHVEAGETLRRTALREVEEESGLRGCRILGELGSVSYRFYQPSKDRNVHKVVYYYRMRAPSEAVRRERIFDRSQWCSVAEAARLLPYPTDLAVLRLLRSARARADRRRTSRRAPPAVRSNRRA